MYQIAPICFNSTRLLIELNE